MVSIMLKVETHVLSSGEVWVGCFSGFAHECESSLKGGCDSQSLVVKYAFQDSTFMLPTTPTNVVMIATGTGVAPFVGMIKDKELALEDSKESVFRNMSLIFGCRNEKEDYLVAKMFGNEKLSKLVNHIIPAFSRQSVN
jgi:sulfite reductase alpha subunit-like flavoprotein